MQNPVAKIGLFLLAAAAWLAGAGDAHAAFLAPELEAIPASAGSAPQEGKQPSDPAVPELATFASHSEAGAPAPPVTSSAGTPLVCATFETTADRLAVASRLAIERERLRPCRGFVPDILRPPRV